MKLLSMSFLAFLAMISLGILGPEQEEQAPDAWKDPLILKEEQGGIAGKSVWIWEVAPTGAWRTQQYHVDNDGQEVPNTRLEKTGKLGEARLKDLADQIMSQGLTGLPANLGKEAKINPHRYILSLGSFQSILEGPGPRRGNPVKDNILQAAPKGDLQADNPWARYSAITHALCQVCQ